VAAKQSPDDHALHWRKALFSSASSAFSLLFQLPAFLHAFRPGSVNTYYRIVSVQLRAAA
jgi:hypothetical protein